VDLDQSGLTRLSFGDRGNTVAHGEGLLRHAVIPACLRTLVQPALCAPDSHSGPLFSLVFDRA
jgi:hypothetical protein